MIHFRTCLHQSSVLLLENFLSNPPTVLMKRMKAISRVSSVCVVMKQTSSHSHVTFAHTGRGPERTGTLYWLLKRETLSAFDTPASANCALVMEFLWAWQRSRYRDWLRAGRSGDRIPMGVEIFRTCSDRPWGPPSPLHNGVRVLPGGKERPGRDADPSPPSSAVVIKEQSYTSNPPMDRRPCTERHCLYMGALYLYFTMEFLICFVPSYVVVVLLRITVTASQCIFQLNKLLRNRNTRNLCQNSRPHLGLLRLNAMKHSFKVSYL